MIWVYILFVVLEFLLLLIPSTSASLNILTLSAQASKPSLQLRSFSHTGLLAGPQLPRITSEMPPDTKSTSPDRTTPRTYNSTLRRVPGHASLRSSLSSSNAVHARELRTSLDPADVPCRNVDYTRDASHDISAPMLQRGSQNRSRPKTSRLNLQTAGRELMPQRGIDHRSRESLQMREADEHVSESESSRYILGPQELENIPIRILPPSRDGSDTTLHAGNEATGDQTQLQQPRHKLPRAQRGPQSHRAPAPHGSTAPQAGFLTDHEFFPSDAGTIPTQGSGSRYPVNAFPPRSTANGRSRSPTQTARKSRVSSERSVLCTVFPEDQPAPITTQGDGSRYPPFRDARTNDTVDVLSSSEIEHVAAGAIGETWAAESLALVLAGGHAARERRGYGRSNPWPVFDQVASIPQIEEGEKADDQPTQNGLSMLHPVENYLIPLKFAWETNSLETIQRAFMGVTTDCDFISRVFAREALVFRSPSVVIKQFKENRNGLLRFETFRVEVEDFGGDIEDGGEVEDDVVIENADDGETDGSWFGSDEDEYQLIRCDDYCIWQVLCE